MTAPDALVEALARRLYADLPTVVYHGDGTEQTLPWEECGDDERAWLLHQVRLVLSGCTVAEEHRTVARDRERNVPVQGDWGPPAPVRVWLDLVEAERYDNRREQRPWVITTAAEEVGG